MNNKIRNFTIISFLLIVILLSINFSKNQKYSLNNKDNLSTSNKEESSKNNKLDELEKLNNMETLATSTQNNESNLIKPLTFSWPVKGNILIKFSPNEMIYDEILDQYRTSNGVVMKTQNKELLSMCDGKITSIIKNNDFKTEITIKTTENHTIIITGNFENVIQKEGNIILKGNKIGDIKLLNEFSYIDITIMKDNEYIDPVSIIS